MHAEKSCRRFPNFVAWVNLVPAGRKLSESLKCWIDAEALPSKARRSSAIAAATSLAGHCVDV